MFGHLRPATNEDPLRTIDLSVDVPTPPELGSAQQTAVTVHLPDQGAVPEHPAVLFCWPGGGYAKEYFALEIDGAGETYSQAAHHVARGLIVVAADHLGTGSSTQPARRGVSLETPAEPNRATVAAVLERLAAGTLAPGVEPIARGNVLGAGLPY